MSPCTHTAPISHEVDPARLAHGKWSHQHNKQIGKGDISASYSADKIGLGQPIRRPFEFRGRLWACVGLSGGSAPVFANAYQIVDPSVFDGEPTTYAKRCHDGDASRADSNGFYHGMVVTHRGQTRVLSGPPAYFVPGQVQQLEMFDSD